MLDNQELNFKIKQLKQLPRTGQSFSDITNWIDTFSDQAKISKQAQGFRILGDEIKKFASNFDIFEDRAKMFNRMLGTSSELSLKYAEDIDKIAVILGRNAENYKAVFGAQTQYFKGTAQLYRKNKELYEGEQLLLTNLTEKFKLTTAQTVAFKRNTLAAGYNTKGMYQQSLQIGAAIEKMDLYDGAATDLLKSLSDIPVDLFTRLTAGLGPDAIKNLGLTVLKANQLKMSMTGIEKTGRSFLDVQEKSTQELFLQEITGKAMLTDEGESFQQELTRAYVERDVAKQQKLIGDLILKNKDGIQNSVLIQEAFADYLNMSAEELLNVISAEENLNQIAEKNLKDRADGHEKILAPTQQQIETEKERISLQEHSLSQLNDYIAGTDQSKSLNEQIKKDLKAAGMTASTNTDETQAQVENLEKLLDIRTTPEFLEQAISATEAEIFTTGSGYARRKETGKLRTSGQDIMGTAQKGILALPDAALNLSAAANIFSEGVNTFKKVIEGMTRGTPLTERSTTIESAATKEVEDLILTPSGQTYRTDPMDYIFAMKNPGRGATGGATGGTDVAAISNAIRNGFATSVTGGGTDVAAISNAIRNGFARINSAPRPISVEVDGLNIIKATELARAQGGNYA